MAFKLTKEEKATKLEHVAKIQAAAKALDAEIEAVNAAVGELNTRLTMAYSEYNEVLGSALGFVEDIVAEREGEFDDKSESWQESDRGEDASSWLESWRDAVTGLEELDAELITVPSVYELEEADCMNNLPDEI